MSAYFVTSTGTDIGKTFVTAGLIRYLRQSSQPVAALKPVVSGYDSSVVETSDPAVLLRALGRPVSADEIAAIAPFRFRAPLSPDIAAAREGRSIDFEDLLKFSRDAVAARSTVNVERSMTTPYSSAARSGDTYSLMTSLSTASMSRSRGSPTPQPPAVRWMRTSPSPTFA